MTKTPPPSSTNSFSQTARSHTSGGAPLTDDVMGAAPVLHFAWQDWLPYFESDDVPEEQKCMLIETLWSIVIAFVDLGWQLQPAAGGDHHAMAAALNAPAHGTPVQSCGQTLDLKTALEAAMLRSDGTSGGKEAR